MDQDISFVCELPKSNYDVITLGHGGGGQLTQNLLDYVFRPAFDNPMLRQQHDSTRIDDLTGPLAFTTDSYVVDPLFFPGGNIGQLAIVGTLNDLAMRGACPVYLSCGFILTEGLPMTTLIQVVDHMRKTALAHHIQIIAGDIKVVEKAAQPSVYINTTGIGQIISPLPIGPTSIESHDAIIVSQDIGRHGIAVLNAREHLELEPPIESDCQALWPLVQQLLESHIPIHCLRDLTRGGLGGALIELAQSSALNFRIEQSSIPVCCAVNSACELLGLDPLYVANEGTMVLFVPQSAVSTTLALLHRLQNAPLAQVIGSVVPKTQTGCGEVHLKTPYGSWRKLTLFSGEQLPRIC